MTLGHIYVIEDRVTGKLYVGQTVNVKGRMHKHQYGEVRYLGNAIRKRGWDNFSWMVIDTVPVEDLNAAEVYWIGYLNTRAPYGYNLTDGGGGAQGLKHSPETILKMSNAKKGKKHSAETRAKMSASQRKTKRPSMRGRPLTDDHKAAISDGLKGREFSEEHRRKLSEANKGKSPSAETRRKIGMAGKGRKQSPETVAKRAAALRGKKKPPDALAKAWKTRRKNSGIQDWVDMLNESD